MVQVGFEDFYQVPDLKFNVSRLRKDLDEILNFFNGGEQARIHLVACILENSFN